MNLLSHYTTRSGLEGISQTKTLWATDFLDLKDQSEIFYGLTQLTKVCLEVAMSEIPPEKVARKHTTEELHQLGVDLTSALRSIFESTPSGHIFVTSFATPKNPDHERRGIRSLWKQVGEDGYCLQFSSDEVERFLQREAQRFNHAFIRLTPVSYALDEHRPEFSDLRFQFKERLLAFVASKRPDVQLKLKHENWWPDPYFFAALMSYCAQHKDPYFEDEREFRVIAAPADEGQGRILEGFAEKKKIKMTPSGRRYINIGDGWDYGIDPTKILIGPRASRDIDDITSRFRRRPEVLFADSPERF